MVPVPEHVRKVFGHVLGGEPGVGPDDHSLLVLPDGPESLGRLCTGPFVGRRPALDRAVRLLPGHEHTRTCSAQAQRDSSNDFIVSFESLDSGAQLKKLKGVPV